MGSKDTQLCSFWLGMSDKVKHDIEGTGSVSVHPDPMIEVRFYVPPCFLPNGNVFPLYMKGEKML